jgi:hypothetical protein
MMDEAETVFATVEEQNPENVDRIKRRWEEALCDLNRYTPQLCCGWDWPWSMQPQ